MNAPAPRYPGVSFILEWENAKHAGCDRAASMLGELSRQIAALRGAFLKPPEIIILFDASAQRKADIAVLVARHWDAHKYPADIRIEPAQSPGYYAQKNYGATLSDRDWLVFVDSDIIPEADWLEKLLNARHASNAAIVSGQTYVAPTSLSDRAFALMWFFPLRSDATAPYDSDVFYANNFVIERSVFLSRPFPDMPLHRGQCYLLAHAIRAAGDRVEMCPAAHVSHPPPNGVLHFVKRALAAGHDFAVTDDMLGHEVDRSKLARSLSRAKWHIIHGFNKISKRGPDLGLGMIGRINARMLAVTYYSLAVLGELLSRAAPRTVFNLLKV